MRNTGPGIWREWRWGTNVVPLYCKDPKVKPVEGEKSVNDLAFLTLRGLMAKNCVAKLTDAIAEMVKEPDSQVDGRIKEDRFRDILKDVALANLSSEEIEAIWPSPIVEEDVQVKRKGSKLGRKKSTDGSSRAPSKEPDKAE